MLLVFSRAWSLSSGARGIDREMLLPLRVILRLRDDSVSNANEIFIEELSEAVVV